MMLLRYFHTLRHLRPGQFIGRLQQRIYRPRPDLRLAPDQRGTKSAWVSPCAKEQVMWGPDHFRFLNDERVLTFPDAWNAPEPGKLWAYNLHYFDDLTAVDASQRETWHRDLMARWIQDNPAVRGIGWEPYPTSLRLVNWIKWSLAGHTLSAQAIQSLAVQARHLRRRLEFHLLGNHLFENAKALVFAGLFFAGEEAEAWRNTGTRLLDAQIHEQVLPDGGHFELSPMYHAIILEGVLDLINLSKAFGVDVPAGWTGAVPAMLEWLRQIVHADGEFAFFNDTAFGVAPKLGELELYATRLGLALPPRRSSSALMQASGYARLVRDDAVVLADVAAVGPDYLPGHAHADSLSFELSLGTRRVLVNSGTSVYGTGPERQRQRGTAAHNTLRIDGCDSSDVWSGFRVGRRAKVRVERFVTLPDLILTASHDGYRHLPGRPTHRRTWVMDAQQLRLEDHVDGRGKHTLEIFFHVHPDFDLLPTGQSAFVIAHKGGQALMTLMMDAKLSWQVEPASWHPRFNVSVDTTCLHGRYQGPLPAQFASCLQWRH